MKLGLLRQKKVPNPWAKVKHKKIVNAAEHAAAERTKDFEPKPCQPAPNVMAGSDLKLVVLMKRFHEGKELFHEDDGTEITLE